MQVLLVDDSKLMRHYVARTLRMTGLDVVVHEAGNGRDAVAKALEIRPDLIVTDLNMPEMSGIELVARIHGIRELSHTPMLVLTADRSAGRAEEALGAGAVGYLAKPVTPETLRRHLLPILEGQS